MGARKRNMANQMKEERKSISFAKLNDCPTSPRKMRLIADMVRGVEVNKALSMLRYCPKEASVRVEKLFSKQYRIFALRATVAKPSPWRVSP